jgi:predicted RNase H-like HicB family nuclease
VHREKGTYVAECLEVSVVTQGKTMDEVLFNLKEAIGLHLDGEDLGSLGLTENPLLVVTCELRLGNAPA